MNKLIKQELQKVKSVHLDYSDDTTEIYIPKTTKILATSVNVGEAYRIRVKGLPAEEYFAEIVSMNGDSIKINGVDVNDPSSAWSGYILLDLIEVEEKL